MFNPGRRNFRRRRTLRAPIPTRGGFIQYNNFRRVRARQYWRRLNARYQGYRSNRMRAQFRRRQMAAIRPYFQRRLGSDPTRHIFKFL